MNSPTCTRDQRLGPFPLDTRISSRLPMLNKRQKELLAKSISTSGQAVPVLVYRGKLVAGRCRQEILVNLRMPILYTNLPDTLTIEQVYNKMLDLHTHRTRILKRVGSTRKRIR